jgi:hypothetical protein
MALLNPSNAALTTLTFTTVGTGVTTDDLGNTVRNQATVTVEAIVTPLQPQSLSDIQQSLGVDVAGIPVKVRCESWPDGVGTQSPATCTLTYNDRNARITLSPLRAQNPHAAALGLGVGVSSQGILTYL